MELVDQLLSILAGPNPGFVSQQLMAADTRRMKSEALGTSHDPSATPSRPVWGFYANQLCVLAVHTTRWIVLMG